MNQTAYEFPTGSSPDPPATGVDTLWREARKNGHVVLTLHCARNGDGYLVACEAFPVGGALGAPAERRSYRFADRQDAELFVHEAARALEYLGCAVQ